MAEEPKVKDLLREMEVVVLRRLEHVEHESRRLRRFGLTLLVGLALLLGLAASLLVITARQGRSVASMVQARQFVLRDESGLARAELGMARDGRVRLLLKDRDGRERLRLTLLPDGSPGVTLADRDGHPRAVLGVLPDEISLVLADQKGTMRAMFGLSGQDAATLVLADRNGEPRARLAVAGDGSPSFTVVERAGSAPVPEEPADTAGEGSGAERATRGPARGK